MKESPINMGIDDAQFTLKSGSKTTDLIGVICQGTRMVGVKKKEITLDGNDATDAIIYLIKQNKKLLQYVFTDTITFGGFNLIDLEKIYTEVNIPIISVTDRMVDLDSVKNALIKNFPNEYPNKLQSIVNAGVLYETKIETAGGQSTIFFHSKGIEYNEVKSLLKKVCIDSKLPESVRLAHIIGKMF